jgi:Domain of Unknown Function (DUF1080)
MRLLTSLILGIASLSSLAIGAEDGFVPMFNGKDLSGWRPVNVASDTFAFRDGMVITTGIPTGFMATDRMYENFIIELDWRHMKDAGNSGVFIWGEGLPAPGVPYARGIEVQVLDLGYERNKGAWEGFTSHGDIFPIWGATMTPIAPIAKNGKRSFPSEKRVKPSPEWNHYRITCNAGEIRLEVNGKQVTVGKDCTPRKGFICLESEGSEAHFKNVMIKELPSTQATPAQTARSFAGYHQLFDGKTLAGWKPNNEGAWQADGPTFSAKSVGEQLWTTDQHGDYELIIDWQTKKSAADAAPAVLHLRGAQLAIQLGGAAGSGTVVNNSVLCPPKLVADLPDGKWNRGHIVLREGKLSITINDQTVIESMAVTTEARGTIGLSSGKALQFSNLFIKEAP